MRGEGKEGGVRRDEHSVLSLSHRSQHGQPHINTHAQCIYAPKHTPTYWYTPTLTYWKGPFYESVGVTTLGAHHVVGTSLAGGCSPLAAYTWTQSHLED